MTKADLYKRRNKNKPRKSSSEPGPSGDQDGEASLIETINSLKHRTDRSSIEDDVALIRANTQDTPVHDTAEPNFEDVPPVKPVEKTYAKTRSKLDDYIYIESHKGLDGTQVAFPKVRAKKSKDSPVPRKRRKVDAPEANESQLRSRGKRSTPATPVVEKRGKADGRVTKESIENEKTVRVTRKRKYEEITKPVLREKGQNGRATRQASERKTIKAKKKETLTLNQQEDQMRMTRSRKRRLEVSLSPSEVKSIVPAFSFESERRVDSVESTKSIKSSTKAKSRRNANGASKAKKTPVRSTRSRGNRRWNDLKKKTANC